MNRLKTLLWVGLVIATSGRTDAQPAPVLRSGPMIGYSEMTEVMLWVQTVVPSEVRIRYWIDGEHQLRTTTGVRTTQDDANIAHIRVADLTPGKRYLYEVLLDDTVIPLSYQLTFQTQQLWQWRTDPPAFSVAVGSCLYINEEAWDRPGKPYGSDEHILTKMLEARPDAMIWLGDNTYYREVDWSSESGLRHRWTHTRSFPGLQPFLGSVYHYYIWDDHDYGPNDADRSYRLRSEAFDVHRLFTANQSYGTPETAGAFSRFEWADAEFVLLDDRYHRSPNDTPDDDPEKTMWGTGQVRWLKDVLLNSRAPFKIIVNGNQVLNPLVQYEGLARFQREYEELLRFIRNNRIAGVVFVTGDRHMTELIRIEEKGSVPLYDFTCSSLTAGLASPRGRETDNPYRVKGTLVADAHTFGLLRFSGPRTNRVLTLECRDAGGDLRWTHEIQSTELLPQSKEGR